MLTEARILSEESLETLRNLNLHSKENIFMNLQDLSKIFEIKLVESSIKWESSTQLKLPESSSWEKNFDRENATVIYNALSNLTPSGASDERFWVTLAFDTYFEYSAIRWGVDHAKLEDVPAILKNHWFCPTSRSRWRDHSISRLWWIGYLAHNSEVLKPSQALDVLYLNSELTNSFLGHPRSTSSRIVGNSLLELVHEEYLEKQEFEFDRNCFREFMHLVDLRGGKLQLESLSRELLREILHECFLKAHKELRKP